MTRGAIETKIDKTRRAFVQLREQLVAVPPSVPQGLEVLEEIVTTMEELEVAAEELRGQNDELAAARRGRHKPSHLIPRGGSTVRMVRDVSAHGDQASGRPRLYWVLHDPSRAERQVEGLESALEREHQAMARMRALDELKNEALEDLSHDLRNPLTAIVGFASVLETIDLSQEQARDAVRRMAANARKLERFLSQLLDFDTKTQGSGVVHRQPTDVTALAQS